jgi:ribosomal protein S18 acetylase RimI-like enzyme
MDLSAIRLVELTDINDDLLLPWLDIYERAFQPEEKEPVSTHLSLLKQKMRGEKTATSMLAAVDADGALVGIIKDYVASYVNTCALWYFATSVELRGQGLGAHIYRLWADKIRAQGVRALIYEVEIPEEGKTPEEQALSRRRIDFYKRLGAKRITGIHYMQGVEFYPPVPMHLMIHSLKAPLSAQEAFDIAKAIFEDDLEQVGPLGLEGLS